MMKDIPNRVPAFCPLCKLLMQGHKSTTTYYKFGVCQNCFIEYVEGREKKWEEGWRPDPAAVEKYSQRMRKSLAELEESGE